jgi:hypothetical protein
MNKKSRLSLRTGVFSFGKEAGTAGQCSEKIAKKSKALEKKAGNDEEERGK